MDTSILDIERRRLILVGTVDEEMLLKVLLALDILEAHNNQPIYLTLSTLGGSAYDALGVYDRIKLSPCQVSIEAIGPIMSAGTVILQASNRRILNPSTRFMIHYGSTSSGGSDEKTVDVISRVLFEKREDESLIDHIYFQQIKRKNKKFKLVELKKMLSTDTYLTPQQAVDLGLADEIKGKTK